MSLMGNWMGNKALSAHSKNDYQKALQLYDEAYAKGMNSPRLLRSYCVLLIRYGKTEQAAEILEKLKKTPKLSDKDQFNINVDYSIIYWKRGDIDKALELLRTEMTKKRNGTLYSILGYLLIEKGDKEAALAANREALEYDESDPVFLDNMGQTYYRLYEDKVTAKPYFEKALSFKPAAIDTNYFLALYDIEEGNIESAKKRLHIALEGFSSPLNYATRERIEQKLKEIN